MKNDTEYEALFSPLRRLRVPGQARARIHATLERHLAENPVREGTFARLQGAVAGYFQPSPYQSYLKKPMPIIAAILIAVFLGGGTSYAAGAALPGDFLYPVKIHVNESVQETLAFSLHDRAKVAADLAAKRLEEAEALAAQGRLNASAAADLEANFSGHIGKANARIKELAESDASAAAEINSSLAARIAANQDILSVFAGSIEDRGPITGLIASLTAHLSTANREDVALHATASSSAQFVAALEVRAKAVLNLATKAVSAATSTATSTNQVSAVFIQRAEASLAIATARYNDGVASLTAGATTTAYGAFLDSIHASVQAQMYARAAIHASIPAFERPARHENESRSASTTTGDDHGQDGDRSQGSLNGSVNTHTEDSLNVEDTDVETNDDVHVDTNVGGGSGSINVNGGVNLNFGI